MLIIDPPPSLYNIAKVKQKKIQNDLHKKFLIYHTVKCHDLSTTNYQSQKENFCFVFENAFFNFQINFSYIR